MRTRRPLCRGRTIGPSGSREPEPCDRPWLGCDPVAAPYDPPWEAVGRRPAGACQPARHTRGCQTDCRRALQSGRRRIGCCLSRINCSCRRGGSRGDRPLVVSSLRRPWRMSRGGRHLSQRAAQAPQFAFTVKFSALFEACTGFPDKKPAANAHRNTRSWGTRFCVRCRSVRIR